MGLIYAGPWTFQWGCYYRIGDRIYVSASKPVLPAGFHADPSGGINIKKEDGKYIFDVKVYGWAKEYV